MPKKNCAVTRRAWNLLRLALLWTRKGGVFKSRFITELRLLPKYVRGLGHSARHDQIYYRERELSFDKTPIFRVNMHRAGSMRFQLNFPCITPQVDFDHDFYGEDDDEVCDYDSGRKSFLKGEEKEEERGGEDGCEEMVPYDEEGIDLRAEQFIAKFYEQIKQQK